MTDSYAHLAHQYDLMVDWPTRLKRERPFFARLFAEIGVKRVLDIGCGTGQHARMFAEMGAEVIGLDPSVPMLEQAKAQAVNGNPQFVTGGFADVAGLSEQFDLITVLGNTLAHAKNPRDLEHALAGMRHVLTPGGRVVIQVVNYDSLAKAGTRWLPPIARHADGMDYLFLREYRHFPRHVEFTVITLMRDDEGWHQHVEVTEHIPLTGDLMQLALRHAGLPEVTLYGDFAGAPYDLETSGALIAVAGR